MGPGVPFTFCASFLAQLLAGVHHFATDTFRLMLVFSPAPHSSQVVKADLREIASGHGYPSGGVAMPARLVPTGDGIWCMGTDLALAAQGGQVGPFRYVVLYSAAPTQPLAPLIGWWDTGESILLEDGDTFTLQLLPGGGLFSLEVCPVLGIERLAAS